LDYEFLLLLRMTSRRFARQLDFMAEVFARVRRPVALVANICTLFLNACWGEVSLLRRSRDG